MHGLENAFQTDVYNTANLNRDEDEQQALFLVQLEIVRPKTMLVMVPLEKLQHHFQADGFDFEFEHFEPNVGRVKCKPPAGSEFSFFVFRIWHYTMLRYGERKQAEWVRSLEIALSTARLSPET